MDDSQAFLFYADKFYSGTADMLPETVGIYIRLLSKLWNMPEGLPNDLKKLARLSLVSERKFNQCWNNDMLSEKFFENSNGMLLNERLEIIREKRLRKSIVARESAEKRWTKTDANAMQTHSERNANGMHISKDKISKVNLQKEYIDEIEYLRILEPYNFSNEIKEHLILQYKNRIAKKQKLTETAAKMIAGDLKKWQLNYSEQEILKAIKDAIKNNWTGIFEPKKMQTEPKGKLATALDTHAKGLEILRRERENETTGE